MSVSIVIPTCNREKSLVRLLRSLSLQTTQPSEVIIVDSSEPPIDQLMLRQSFSGLSLGFLRSSPSVCRQRNIGIRAATSRYVFLCDDDMEAPPEYIQRITEYFERSDATGAASGIVLEPVEGGRFNNGFHPVSLLTLLSNFIFQHTVWADLGRMKAAFPASLLLSWLRRFYLARGNTFTLAGWPLLTMVEEPITRTSIYGLGGSIVLREWLLQSPFDESLDRYGIGDNYGVALGFPETKPIAILTTVSIYHHRVPDNRLPRGETYLRRVLALNYFMAGSRRFSMLNRVMLRWSIIGNLLGSFLAGHKEMRSASLTALRMLTLQRNHGTPSELE
jgi:glycosyltransferase involved in cell wall biosynthesis